MVCSILQAPEVDFYLTADRKALHEGVGRAGEVGVSEDRVFIATEHELGD
jgi:isopentenyl diphosphate isomerase/L-lactate dehydrogenase-like FMN-dependent dehydrogenase